MTFSVRDAPSCGSLSFSQPSLHNLSVILGTHNKETAFPTAHSLTTTYCPLYVRNESQAFSALFFGFVCTTLLYVKAKFLLSPNPKAWKAPFFSFLSPVSSCFCSRLQLQSFGTEAVVLLLRISLKSPLFSRALDIFLMLVFYHHLSPPSFGCLSLD